MIEQPRTTVKAYKSTFAAWAEAIMQINSAHGRKPVENQKVRTQDNHGSRYVDILPKLIADFQVFDLGPEEGETETYCATTYEWLKNWAEKNDVTGERTRSLEIDVRKSSLLARLVYDKEKFRTVPCPEHQGLWSGLPGKWNGDCDAGCDLTGWLPEDVRIEDMMAQRRSRAIDRAKKFVADNPTSPFTATENPEKSWLEWREREARELHISTAELGVPHRPRPTPAEIQDANWWKNIDQQKLEKYLANHGWTRLEGHDDKKKSWWKYAWKSASGKEGLTCFMIPEGIEEDYTRLISIPNATITEEDRLRRIREAITDIADIQGIWLIDLLCESQDLGTRPIDLRSEKFLKSLTPAMFSIYLVEKGWKILGDDGHGNHLWQHKDRPKIYHDSWRSPSSTRYLSPSIVRTDIDYDPNRTIGVVTNEDYDDYGMCVNMILDDLHRHENRDKCAIVDDILATAR